MTHKRLQRAPAKSAQKKEVTETLGRIHAGSKRSCEHGKRCPEGLMAETHNATMQGLRPGINRTEDSHDAVGFVQHEQDRQHGSEQRSCKKVEQRSAAKSRA
jgi:hypothetical protein